jgi:dTMP kinase
MTPRGKLVAIEGIDGSGKATQIELLAGALKARGVSCARFRFPRYESTFGQQVARFLNGEFGKLDEVDPHLSAALYAGDRFEAKANLEAALAAGKTVLADRYIGSNLAHQTARVPTPKHEQFITWLKDLEYGVYGLPQEDLVIYLRLPAKEAHRLVGLKPAREYTTRARDILESDVKHLEEAAAIYDRLAIEPPWVKIDCVDAGTGALRSPDAIHRDVLNAFDARFGVSATARQNK